jgi:hypothetical protein
VSTKVEIDEYCILHALKVRGFADAEQLSESIGIPAADIHGYLTTAGKDGLVKQRSGRINGFTLTSSGRERRSQLRESAVTPDQVSALTPIYEEFLAPNRQFKKLTTDWQLHADGDISVVLPRLDEVHSQVSSILASATAVIDRFKYYQPRFDRSLAAFRNGETGALTLPLSGSYHDIWMELHEDLLTTLARERTDADE